VNVVNIGGDYEIGRSVCPSFRVCTRWLRNDGAFMWILLHFTVVM